MDAALGIFREAGFVDDVAPDAYFTVSSYVTGFCAWQVAGKLAPEERAALSGYITRVASERYPNLLAVAPRIFSASLDERFVFGLDAMLAGLAQRLPDPA